MTYGRLTYSAPASSPLTCPVIRSPFCMKITSVFSRPRSGKAENRVNTDTVRRICNASSFSRWLISQDVRQLPQYILPFGVLAVDPPVEVLHKPLERALQEAQIGAPQLGLDPEQKQRRPGMYRRIHIAEVPLIRRNLAVRMGV